MVVGVIREDAWAADGTCGLAIYQMLPSEGSDPGEQQKASRAHLTSLGVCGVVFLSLEAHP